MDWVWNWDDIVVASGGWWLLLVLVAVGLVSGAVGMALGYKKCERDYRHIPPGDPGPFSG